MFEHWSHACAMPSAEKCLVGQHLECFVYRSAVVLCRPAFRMLDVALFEVLGGKLCKCDAQSDLLAQSYYIITFGPLLSLWQAKWSLTAKGRSLISCVFHCLT